MTWPQQDSGIEIGEWSVDDLQVGDLVFGQKPAGPLAWLCDVANEPWRHVGSTVMHEGELKVVEVAGDKFQLVPLSKFFSPDKYTTWGAARLRVGPSCVVAANEWMLKHLAGGTSAQQVYAWDDLILAGIISASKRGLIAKDPERVKAAIQAAGQRCKDTLEFKGQTSITCSAFVQLAYENSGSGCRIEHRVWRSESGSWPTRPPSVDTLFDMTEAELAGFDDLSLLDLHAAAKRVDRATDTTRARPGHIAELLKMLVAGVSGYWLGTTPPDELGHDNRWVTPGNLWESPSVYARAWVVPR